MVRLKEETTPNSHERQPRFNSKMVRLKAGLNATATLHNFCFNSKMVRLKGAENGHELVLVGLFQFQNGAIKRA